VTVSVSVVRKEAGAYYETVLAKFEEGETGALTDQDVALRVNELSARAVTKVQALMSAIVLDKIAESGAAVRAATAIRIQEAKDKIAALSIEEATNVPSGDGD
jgi:hypothetical protein